MRLPVKFLCLSLAPPATSAGRPSDASPPVTVSPWMCIKQCTLQKDSRLIRSRRWKYMLVQLNLTLMSAVLADIQDR